MRSLIFAVMLAGASGCDNVDLQGAEGQLCYPNETCDGNLSCVSGRCVQLPDNGVPTPDEPDGGVDSQAPTDSGQPDTTPPQPLTWSECDTTDWPRGYPKPPTGVECTTIDVPLDHDGPDGDTIALRVARHRAVVSTTRAVFQLAGGPGGGSVFQSGLIPSLMPDLRTAFDLIYVDQRGTGGSGSLDCPGAYPETEAQWKLCGQQLSTAPLEHYGTLAAAHDLDLVRARLGYDKIYLRGGSYGTRLGLEYLRQHEDRVVTAVLDGVSTPDLDAFATTIEWVDRAVKVLVDECASSTSCLAVSPSFEQDLEAWRKQLQSSPREILVDGQPSYEDEETFRMLLYAGLDYAPWRYKIPRAIHQAVKGVTSNWDALVSQIVGMKVTSGTQSESARVPLRGLIPSLMPQGNVSYVASGLFGTVACAEWLPNSVGVSALETLEAQQKFSYSSMVDIARACVSFQVKPLSKALRAPVSSMAKLLLISGGVDIRTPPENAEHAAKTLPNATHIVVPYASHSTMGVPCAGQIITDFLANDGEIAKVDTSCIKARKPPTW